MGYVSSYEPINWQNSPSVATPINATNLNKMDSAIDALDEAMGQISAASRVFSMNAESVASDKITAYIGDDSIGGAKDLIILNTLNKSGTTGSSWSLYLVSPVPGGATKTLALKNADGSAAYADAVDANAIMFILVTSSSTANVVGVVNSSNIDFPLSIDKGGTGNTDGYIRTGQAENTTIGTCATAEGFNNIVSGDYSHSEGRSNIVNSNYSHAEGKNNVASGDYSHAGGLYTVTAYDAQTAIGKYNDNKSDSLFEVGNGTGIVRSDRSNALEVKSNGDVIAGNDVIDGDGNSISGIAEGVSTPKTATGNPLVIEDALESNADGLIAQIVPIQSGSGDPSPENVRPISGRTEVNLGRGGKNLWPYGDLDTAGRQNLALALKSGTYSFRGNRSSMNLSLALRFNHADDTSTLVNITSFIGQAITLDKPFVSVNYGIGSFSEGEKIYNVQLEYGSQATPYEPYITPVTLTIALGTTIYGGSLDAKTGVLTISWRYDTFDGSSDELWAYDSGRGQFYITNSAIDNKAKGLIVSDSYKGVQVDQWSELHNGEITVHPTSNNVIRLMTDLYNSLDAFKTAISTTPIHVCYEINTPTTIQLTANDLALLMGYNRVTSDSGDITLTYKANAVQDLQTDKADNADIVDFIENGNKASRAYTANQFMLWKGDLYKVTTSIASGATITAGTNVTKTTIGAVLTALLNA